MKEGEEKKKTQQIRIDRISKGTLSVTITIMEMRRWSHFRGEPSVLSRRVGGGWGGGPVCWLDMQESKTATFKTSRVSPQKNVTLVSAFHSKSPQMRASHFACLSKRL